jgi:Mg/Co/Ni transporter MgtE
MMLLEKQKEISLNLSKKHRKRIHRILNYSMLSAGDLMNPNVDMLPGELTVADAVRRLGQYREPVKYELYIVDASHGLIGVVEIGKLLTSKQQVRLRDIMTTPVQSLSIHASAESMLVSPGWMGRQRLPVVDSDNTLVGILDYTRLKAAVDRNYGIEHNPTSNLFNLVGLYWLSMTQLLDSLLNVAASKKEIRNDR